MTDLPLSGFRIGVTAARVGVAALLLGLSVAPFWTARRTTRRRLRRAKRTCPRCFRLNTLKVERAGGGGGGKSRYRPAKGKKKPARPAAGGRAKRA